jgi:hypothetical protein
MSAGSGHATGGVAAREEGLADRDLPDEMKSRTRGEECPEDGVVDAERKWGLVVSRPVFSREDHRGTASPIVFPE